MYFQDEIDEWMTECFGDVIKKDKTERNARFIEEAIELVQSTGATREDVHMLVDYVFNRPIGEVRQEIGGVMVTLAALCNVLDVDIESCYQEETKRIWTKVEQIREKQKSKPKNSPLPE